MGGAPYKFTKEECGHACSCI